MGYCFPGLVLVPALNPLLSGFVHRPAPFFSDLDDARTYGLIAEKSRLCWQHPRQQLLAACILHSLPMAQVTSVVKTKEGPGFSVLFSAGVHAASQVNRGRIQVPTAAALSLLSHSHFRTEGLSLIFGVVAAVTGAARISVNAQTKPSLVASFEKDGKTSQRSSVHLVYPCPTAGISTSRRSLFDATRNNNNKRNSKREL